MTSGNNNFYLRIYDNYHYMDEGDSYNHGQYDTYEDALMAAKAIVDDFLEHNWTSGIKPESLIMQYCLYGEDPVIRSIEPVELKPFSARDYASISAKKICRKLNK